MKTSLTIMFIFATTLIVYACYATNMKEMVIAERTVQATEKMVEYLHIECESERAKVWPTVIVLEDK